MTHHCPYNQTGYTRNMLKVMHLAAHPSFPILKACITLYWNPWRNPVYSWTLFTGLHLHKLDCLRWYIQYLIISVLNVVFCELMPLIYKQQDDAVHIVMWRPVPTKECWGVSFAKCRSTWSTQTANCHIIFTILHIGNAWWCLSNLFWMVLLSGTT